MQFESSTENNAWRVLEVLAKYPRDDMGFSYLSGEELAKLTGLDPPTLNDTVTLIVQAGFAEWRQLLGTAPYVFADVGITPRGRYEYEKPKITRKEATPSDKPSPILPPAPVGSPYGFQDQDWEVVADRKEQKDVLFVVLGAQFKSSYYDTATLQANLQSWFERAIDVYNDKPAVIPCELDFRGLAAGYGEHLFNEIARDIIASDIAVFEASDLNPNVMLEMGVALTWGVRVLPIKLNGRPGPPSDISGQTWADYTADAAAFEDPKHLDKLVRMVERAMRKKGRV